MVDFAQTFLRAAIVEVLPDLPEMAKDRLEETLQSLGVETNEDLNFIKEKKLLALTLEKSCSSVDASERPSTSQLPLSPASSISTSSNSSLSSGNDWVDSFAIPWAKFQEVLIQSLERGKPPTPRMRWKMVRIVVTEMMRKHSNTGKRKTTEVAKRMVAVSPISARCD